MNCACTKTIEFVLTGTILSTTLTLGKFGSYEHKYHAAKGRYQPILYLDYRLCRKFIGCVKDASVCSNYRLLHCFDLPRKESLNYLLKCKYQYDRYECMEGRRANSSGLYNAYLKNCNLLCGKHRPIWYWTI